MHLDDHDEPVLVAEDIVDHLRTILPPEVVVHDDLAAFFSPDTSALRQAIRAKRSSPDYVRIECTMRKVRWP
jgi:hypothetical protein